MKKSPVPGPSRTGAASVRAPAPAGPVFSTPTDRCRLDGWTLRIPPLRILRHGQLYTSPAELAIDLATLDSGRYRLLAVHNFHVEDRNPRLDECVAGAFLAAQRRDGAWEEPERFPIECRALEVLAELDVPSKEGKSA